MSHEIIPSISIANLVNQRDAVVSKLLQACALIEEASTLARAANLGMPRFRVGTTFGKERAEPIVAPSYLEPRHMGHTFSDQPSSSDEVRQAIQKTVDGVAWQYLMNASGVRSLMDANARAAWDKGIQCGEVPELDADTVRATFERLYSERADMFERGVVACFKGLSWQHKTNQPQKFGKRIVLRWLRSAVVGKGAALGSASQGTCNQLDDLVRVMSVLDGKPEPDHRCGWFTKLSWKDTKADPPKEDEYLIVRSFRNGRGHVTFKRLDLVDKMNLIIAKHYPGALPAPK